MMSQPTRLWAMIVWLCTFSCVSNKMFAGVIFKHWPTYQRQTVDNTHSNSLQSYGQTIFLSSFSVLFAISFVFITHFVCDGNIFVLRVLETIRNYILALLLSLCVCFYSRNEDKSRQQICPIFSAFRKFQQQQFIKCLFSAHPRSIQNWIGCQRKLLAINQKEFILMNLSIALHLLSYSPALTLAVLRRLTFSSNPGYFGPSKRVALYCFNFVAQFNF